MSRSVRDDIEKLRAPKGGQAGKGHVPEENLAPYREIAGIARRLNILGNTLSGTGDHDKANLCWSMSREVWDKADALRVDL